MKNLVIAGILILIGFSPSFAQDMNSSEQAADLAQLKLKNDTTVNKIKAEFSFFAGITIFGTKSKIRSSMIDYGFDDRSSGGWFSGPHNHPQVTGAPSIDLELTIFLKNRSGITLTAALSEYSEISGYNNNVGHLSITSRVVSWSLGYTYKSSDLRNQFTVAPALMSHKIAGPVKIEGSEEEIKYKIGLYACWTYKLVNKRHWFLNFKTTARWAPSTTVGPYTKEITNAWTDGENVIETYTFEATKVNVIIINAGLAIGWQKQK
ncbi:hypothetical protein [Maribellus sediminis]|uniref:hypothetical protein n=1 Tax=Maribellus sediminis TaxID=2696285 RepID=UPI001430C74B|nr:hypothetical protein [Maribellus sediminis]